jgi:hypothetical protein
MSSSSLLRKSHIAVERSDFLLKLKCKHRMSDWSSTVSTSRIESKRFILDSSLELSHGLDYLESDLNDRRPY